MGIIDWFLGRTKEPELTESVNKRSFHAAMVDRLTMDWAMSPIKVDQDLKKDLRVLRARSRDLAKNSGFAKRYMSLVKNNVIGSEGFAFQSKVIGQRGDFDTPANDAIEIAFKRFSLPGNFDVTGKLSRADAERLFVETVATDGEALVRMVPRYKDSEFDFAIQFLDVEMLDVNYTRPYGKNTIVMGVEYNAWRKPVAYHLTVSESVDETYLHQGARYMRVPADKIIHAFISEFVDQTRGIPWMTAAMLGLKMFSGYQEAALVNARIGASKLGWWKDVDGGGEFTGDDTDSSGNALIDAEVGSFGTVPRNWELVEWSPDYPNNEYAAFAKVTLRGIASAMNVSYHALSGDLESVSFSSIRTGTLEEREVWKGIQGWMINAFCMRVYKQWLAHQLLRGSITLVQGGTGKLLPLKSEREQNYHSVIFQGRRWDWVDPLKDIETMKRANEMGVKSLSEIIRESGRDPQDVWDEMAKDKMTLEQLGITLGEEPIPSTIESEDSEEDGKEDTEENES